MSSVSDVETVWQGLCGLAAARRHGAPAVEEPAQVRELAGDGEAGVLAAIFLPLLARISAQGLVLAHLGQSLDGMIATANGASHYVTGPEDLRHKHRLRALFDATIVGAGTVYHDNPKLTVRLVGGDHPLRVVLDTNRTLATDYKIFQDDVAPTMLICAADKAVEGERHGIAEVVGVARGQENGDCVDSKAVAALLAARGYPGILLEGGGVTVSRFLRAGALDRLHLTVAPLILGAGRPGLALPENSHPDQGLRPVTRHFALGEDMLFDCALHD